MVDLRPPKPLTELGIIERVRRFRLTQDEQAIREVVEHFTPRIARHARWRAEETGLDPADLESAGKVALLEAVRTFDPERGVPFGAHLMRPLRAGMNAEAAVLGGAFVTSRKTETERWNVIQAVKHLRDEQITIRPERAAGAGRRPAEPYRLSPEITDRVLAVLSDRVPSGPPEQYQAAAQLFADVERYLEQALPIGTPPIDVRLMAREQVQKILNPASLRSRQTLEQDLQKKLSYGVTMYERRGLAQEEASQPDFYAQVAARANVSENQARALMESSLRTVSIDETIGDDRPDWAPTVRERIADTRATMRADSAIRDQDELAIAVRDALARVRPESRALLVLAAGLDGEERVSVVDLAWALDGKPREISHLLTEGRQQLKEALLDARHLSSEAAEIVRSEGDRARATRRREFQMQALQEWESGDLSIEIAPTPAQTQPLPPSRTILGLKTHAVATHRADDPAPRQQGVSGNAPPRPASRKSRGMSQ
jgi:DNA-directed RNA polymerase sigma subunit (sigma70/sigma32)